MGAGGNRDGVGSESPLSTAIVAERLAWIRSEHVLPSAWDLRRNPRQKCLKLVSAVSLLERLSKFLECLLAKMLLCHIFATQFARFRMGLAEVLHMGSAIPAHLPSR